jgi:hypothetical protein
MTTNTALRQVDFGGSSASGSAPTSTTSGWVSYTFVRPTVRVTQAGDQVFIVKKLAFTVAGRTSARKVYARVSAPSGSPSSNTSTVTVKAEKQANKQQVFSGASLPFSSKTGGPNMRVWIVSSGDFYFDRNPSGVGHLVAQNGKAFTGSPVGYFAYAEVPSAPNGLTAARDETDQTKVRLAWSREDDTGGGSPSGYYIQWADDIDFSINVASQIVSRFTFTKTGFDAAKTYYFRVCSRTEVTDHFDLKGGDFSAPFTLGPASTPSTAADDFGYTLQPLNYFGPTPAATAGPTLTLTATQRMQDVIRSPDTGEFFVSQSIDPGASAQVGDTTKADVVINRCTSGGSLIDSMTLTDAGHGTTIALEGNSSGEPYIWMAYEDPGTTGGPNDLLRFPYAAGVYTRDSLPGVSEIVKFTSSLVDVSFDWLNGQAASRHSLSGGERYELRRISDIVQGVDKLYAGITLPGAPPAMQGYFTYQDSLFRWTGSSNSTTDPIRLSQYSWADGSVIAVYDASNLGKPYTDNWYEPEGASLYNVDGTAPVAYLGITTGNYPSHEFHTYVLPLLTQEQAVANQGGDTTDPGGSDGSDDGNGTPQTVYSPIPDESGTETQKGGLLLSRQPPNAEHTVFVMDKGGSRRLAQLTGFSSVTWNRQRNDISSASVTLPADAVVRNKVALQRLAVGRSELAIYRGNERVWEGPVTTLQWARSQVVINAQDVLYYALRTVPHLSYSAGFPNTMNAVLFIAGILAGELARKEALDPPINVVPHIRTYVEDGDAKTTKVFKAGSEPVWQLLDDMGASSGINYTVVGRAIHIWDTSRAALGRTRVVTEQDFLGEPYITEYGADLATQYVVSDGQGGWAEAGAPDPYYGEVELVAQAYGEDSFNVLDPGTGQVIGTTITQAELQDQANRNLAGRNPVPTILNIPDNAALDVSRSGLGIDVLVPGVYIPVQATLSGRTMAQVQKLKSLTVKQDSTGETVSVSMTPANATIDPTGADV